MADEKVLGTKEIAAKLKVKAATLRRWLRSKGKNTEGEYSRYEYKEGSPQLTKLMDDFRKHQNSVTDSRKAQGKKLAAGKAKAAKKPKPAAEDVPEEVA